MLKMGLDKDWYARTVEVIEKEVKWLATVGVMMKDRSGSCSMETMSKGQVEDGMYEKEAYPTWSTTSWTGWWLHWRG